MHIRLYGLSQPRLVAVLVQPAAITAIALVVLRDAAGDDAVPRILVGSALAGTWGAVLGTAMFTLRREREWYGTFALLAATPTPLSAVLWGYLLAEAVLSLPGVAVSFAVAFAIVGTGVSVGSPALFAGSLVLAVPGMASLALLVAPAAMLAPALTRWVNIVDYPVWIAAGFLFPIALLPGWTTPVSYALPAYWIAESFRLAAGGTDLGGIAPTWLAVLATTAAFASAAFALAALAAQRLRTTGALVDG